MPNDPSGSGDLIPLPPEEVLTDSEKLLAAYFGSSTIGLAILDRHFRYVAINRTLAAIHRMPAADHLGKTVHEVLGDFAGRADAELQRVLSTGLPALDFQGFAVLGAQADDVHWLANCYPIKDEEGNVARIAVVVVETTAQRNLERSLQEVSQKLRKEMDRTATAAGREQDRGIELGRTSRIPADFIPHPPRAAPGVCRLRVTRSQHGIAGATGRGFPLGKGFLSTVHISPDNSPGGITLRERTARIFTKDELRGFEAEFTKNFLQEGLRSLCCVPILRPKGAGSACAGQHPRRNAFHPDDLTLLNQVAAQFAVALENHRAATRDRMPSAAFQRGETNIWKATIFPTGHFPEIIGDSASSASRRSTRSSPSLPARLPC
jgi:GAF domain-containing protein